MSDIGHVIRGTAFQKKDFSDSGVPCIHYGQIYTSYSFSASETITYIDKSFANNSRMAAKGDLIIATTSENLEDVGKSIVWEGDSTVVVSNDACIFRHNQNPRYIGYLLKTNYFVKFKMKGNCSGTKVIRMNPDTFLEFKAPIPSLADQQRIVEILDRFETLTSDISCGLPAEIEARQQQYEYYRNKLLTFKRVS